MIAGRSAAASIAAASSIPAAGAPAIGRRLGQLGLALAEDDVERVVEEGRAARRGGGEIERRGGHRRDPGRVLDGLRVDLTSGETNGRWSISCSEPEPQRSSGARPPRTQIGEPLA